MLQLNFILQEKDDEQQQIVEQVRTVYLDILKRAAAGRQLSLRARSHLKQACLAAATHKVLLELSPVSGLAVTRLQCYHTFSGAVIVTYKYPAPSEDIVALASVLTVVNCT